MSNTLNNSFLYIACHHTREQAVGSHCAEVENYFPIINIQPKSLTLTHTQNNWSLAK